MEEWLANGAELGWLVDPYERTVTIFRPDTQPQVLDKPDLLRGEGPVEGLTIRFARLWAVKD